jgi:hypothetical protein
MIIIPVGIDCGVAKILKKNDMRKYALPFDWVVTYRGITEILRNDFNHFIPYAIKAFNKYDVKFIHDNLKDENDINKYKRRIERFKELIKNTTEEVLFIKKGHSYHHHAEYNYKDDVEDVIELDNYLQENYKHLNYKIIVALLCNDCYKSVELPDNNRIIFFKNLITDIRHTHEHNVIISELHYEDIFKKKMISFIK